MYLLSSDQHCHAWSQFSSINPITGVNTRLETVLQEFERSVDILEKKGGKHIVLAGDIFHVRGSIDPEVFNPTHAMIKRVLARGMEIYAIPGNHDLKGSDTTELGNAMQTFGAMEGFTVVTNFRHFSFGGNHVAMAPWEPDAKKLVESIQTRLDKSKLWQDLAPVTDLILHVGINEVFPTMPASGVAASDLAKLGFARVFAGHYHHHLVMEDKKVFSIGATTQQTFSDVGKKAGFLIVDKDKVDFHASNAPSFIDITPETPAEEIPLIVDGNFVRVRGFKMGDSEIVGLREGLMEAGAKGVTIQVVRDVEVRRSVKTGKALTLEESLAAYVNSKIPKEYADDVQIKAANILKKVMSLAE
jgi:DNA repair exonuclease SbcCD nuclease subunit